ncbi:MAG: protein-glutamate O-methyltransferase CheR [Planctomycetota bacterium]
MDRDLTAQEFQRYHDLIYKIAGIHYPKEKLELLSNRIRRRIRSIRADSYDAYLSTIQAPGSKELQAFLDSITTNETYFFRCQRHWDFFKDWTKTQLADPARKGQGMRLWSAAASNGSEACTMLIVLHQLFGDGLGGVPIDIVGTDLNAKVVEEARAARFRPYALTQMRAEDVSRYFDADASKEQFTFDRQLLKHARFETHNLMQPLPAREPFDAVFVRNVMIYFDKASREKVLDHIYRILRPGGLLVVGESESLLNVKHKFDYLKPSIFVRPESPVGAPT